MTGLVRRWLRRGDYGFIEGLTGHPGSNPEFYCHISAIKDRIPPPIGAEVKFTPVRSERGLQAANVELIEYRPRGGRWPAGKSGSCTFATSNTSGWSEAREPASNADAPGGK